VSPFGDERAGLSGQGLPFGAGGSMPKP